MLSKLWQANVFTVVKRSNSETQRVTLIVKHISDTTSKNVIYTVNSTKLTRDKAIYILSVHFQWLLQNLRGLCRQNKICAVKLWCCTRSPQSHINCTERIVFTRNLITFAVLHENTRCFVKMKADVIRYIIQLLKY